MSYESNKLIHNSRRLKIWVWHQWLVINVTDGTILKYDFKVVSLKYWLITKQYNGLIKDWLFLFCVKIENFEKLNLFFRQSNFRYKWSIK